MSFGAGAGTKSLVDAIVKHRNFKSLAGYSVKCLAAALVDRNATDAPLSALQHGAVPALTAVIVKHPTAAGIFRDAGQALCAIIAHPACADMLRSGDTCEQIVTALDDAADCVQEEGEDPTETDGGASVLEALAGVCPGPLVAGGGVLLAMRLISLHISSKQRDAAAVLAALATTVELACALPEGLAQMQTDTGVGWIAALTTLYFGESARANPHLAPAFRALERIAGTESGLLLLQKEAVQDHLRVAVAAPQVQVQKSLLAVAIDVVGHAMGNDINSLLDTMLSGSTSASETEMATKMLAELVADDDNVEKLVRVGAVRHVVAHISSPGSTATSRLAAVRILQRACTCESAAEATEQLVAAEGVAALVDVIRKALDEIDGKGSRRADSAIHDKTYEQAIAAGKEAVAIASGALCELCGDLEHAQIVVKHGGVAIVLKALAVFGKHPRIAEHALRFVEVVGLHGHKVSELLRRGAATSSLIAMKTLRRNVAVQATGTRVFILLCSTELGAAACVQGGLIPLLVRNLTEEATACSSVLVGSTLYLIGTLCLVPEFRAAFVDVDAFSSVLAAFTKHRDDVGVMAAFRDALEALADVDAVRTALHTIDKNAPTIRDGISDEEVAEATRQVKASLELLEAGAVSLAIAQAISRERGAHIVRTTLGIVSAVPQVTDQDGLLATCCGLLHQLLTVAPVVDAAEAVLRGAQVPSGSLVDELVSPLTVKVLTGAMSVRPSHERFAAASSRLLQAIAAGVDPRKAMSDRVLRKACSIVVTTHGGVEACVSILRANSESSALAVAASRALAEISATSVGARAVAANGGSRQVLSSLTEIGEGIGLQQHRGVVEATATFSTPDNLAMLECFFTVLKRVAVFDEGRDTLNKQRASAALVDVAGVMHDVPGVATATHAIVSLLTTLPSVVEASRDLVTRVKGRDGDDEEPPDLRTNLWNADPGLVRAVALVGSLARTRAAEQAARPPPTASRPRDLTRHERDACDAMYSASLAALEVLEQSVSLLAASAGTEGGGERAALPATCEAVVALAWRSRGGRLAGAPDDFDLAAAAAPHLVNALATGETSAAEPVLLGLAALLRHQSAARYVLEHEEIAVAWIATAFGRSIEAANERCVTAAALCLASLVAAAPTEAFPAVVRQDAHHLALRRILSAVKAASPGSLEALWLLIAAICGSCDSHTCLTLDEEGVVPAIHVTLSRHCSDARRPSPRLFAACCQALSSLCSHDWISCRENTQDAARKAIRLARTVPVYSRGSFDASLSSALLCLWMSSTGGTSGADAVVGSDAASAMVAALHATPGFDDESFFGTEVGVFAAVSRVLVLQDAICALQSTATGAVARACESAVVASRCGENDTRAEETLLTAACAWVFSRVDEDASGVDAICGELQDLTLAATEVIDLEAKARQSAAEEAASAFDELIGNTLGGTTFSTSVDELNRAAKRAERAYNYRAELEAGIDVDGMFEPPDESSVTIGTADGDDDAELVVLAPHEVIREIASVMNQLASLVTVSGALVPDTRGRLFETVAAVLSVAVMLNESSDDAAAEPLTGIAAELGTGAIDRDASGANKAQYRADALTSGLLALARIAQAVTMDGNPGETSVGKDGVTMKKVFGTIGTVMKQLDGGGDAELRVLSAATRCISFITSEPDAFAEMTHSGTLGVLMDLHRAAAQAIRTEESNSALNTDAALSLESLTRGAIHNVVRGASECIEKILAGHQPWDTLSNVIEASLEADGTGHDLCWIVSSIVSADDGDETIWKMLEEEPGSLRVTNELLKALDSHSSATIRGTPERVKVLIGSIQDARELQAARGAKRVIHTRRNSDVRAAPQGPQVFLLDRKLAGGESADLVSEVEKTAPAPQSAPAKRWQRAIQKVVSMQRWKLSVHGAAKTQAQPSDIEGRAVSDLSAAESVISLALRMFERLDIVQGESHDSELIEAIVDNDGVAVLGNLLDNGAEHGVIALKVLGGLMNCGATTAAALASSELTGPPALDPGAPGFVLVATPYGGVPAADGETRIPVVTPIVEAMRDDKTAKTVAAHTRAYNDSQEFVLLAMAVLHHITAGYGLSAGDAGLDLDSLRALQAALRTHGQEPFVALFGDPLVMALSAEYAEESGMLLKKLLDEAVGKIGAFGKVEGVDSASGPYRDLVVSIEAVRTSMSKVSSESMPTVQTEAVYPLRDALELYGIGNADESLAMSVAGVVAKLVRNPFNVPVVATVEVLPVLVATVRKFPEADDLASSFAAICERFARQHSMWETIHAAGGTAALVEVAMQHTRYAHIMQNVMLALTNTLCDCGPNVDQMVEAGGILALRQVISAHPDNPRLLEDVLCCLSNLVFVSDTIRLQVGSLCLPMIVSVLEHFSKDSNVLRVVLRTIGNLSLCDENVPRIIEKGVIKGIVDGMRSNLDMVEIMCMAIDVVKNLCVPADDPDVDTSECLPTVLKDGGVAVALELMNKHSSEARIGLAGTQFLNVMAQSHVGVTADAIRSLATLPTVVRTARSLDWNTSVLEEVAFFFYTVSAEPEFAAAMEAAGAVQVMLSVIDTHRDDRGDLNIYLADALANIAHEGRGIRIAQEWKGPSIVLSTLSSCEGEEATPLAHDLLQLLLSWASDPGLSQLISNDLSHLMTSLRGFFDSGNLDLLVPAFAVLAVLSFTEMNIPALVQHGVLQAVAAAIDSFKGNRDLMSQCVAIVECIAMAGPDHVELVRNIDGEELIKTIGKHYPGDEEIAPAVARTTSLLASANGNRAGIARAMASAMKSFSPKSVKQKSPTHARVAELATPAGAAAPSGTSEAGSEIDPADVSVDDNYTRLTTGIRVQRWEGQKKTSSLLRVNDELTHLKWLDSSREEGSVGLMNPSAPVQVRQGVPSVHKKSRRLSMFKSAKATHSVVMEPAGGGSTLVHLEFPNEDEARFWCEALSALSSAAREGDGGFGGEETGAAGAPTLESVAEAEV